MFPCLLDFLISPGPEANFGIAKELTSNPIVEQGDKYAIFLVLLCVDLNFICGFRIISPEVQALIFQYLGAVIGALCFCIT